jgi:hypothetical protein
MHSIRRRLTGLASSLLACQLAAMVAAPAVLYQTRAAAAIDGSEILCGCKDEPGALCPMHTGKRQQSSGKQSETLRSCAGHADQAAAVLTLLTSGGGILQTSTQAIRPQTNSVALLALDITIFNADRPPTSPPPRS